MNTAFCFSYYSTQNSVFQYSGKENYAGSDTCAATAISFILPAHQWIRGVKICLDPVGSFRKCHPEPDIACSGEVPGGAGIRRFENK